MKTFEFTIKDELGIHARPAGLIVKEAAKYKDTITIETKGKKADARKLFAIMSLGAKNNDILKITIDGETEEETANAIKIFLDNNL